MDWHAATRDLNPYPQFLKDEATGQVFPDQRHTAWLQGFNAALQATLDSFTRQNPNGESQRGVAPLSNSFPSPLKERGIKGVR